MDVTTPPELARPVAIVGAGPIGLITALGLVRYGVPVVVFEEDHALSLDTKAGTILTRTLEVLDRYDALDDVLTASLRIDEIGELDRATGVSTGSVLTATLTEDTRFPFVINIPQHELEPILRGRLDELAPDVLRMRHRLTSFDEHDDHVVLHLDTPDGPVAFEASRVLACDGGRSQIREQLGIVVEGHTLPQKYMLIDLVCDLDVDNPRDYPYLAYFGDPAEWMILVRQPHCWRFLFPLDTDAEPPTQDELVDKARSFIGEVSGLEVLGSNIYPVHHRVAETWQVGRVFLMGDAAHLITPMWALGLNTGVLDASNLPWRLAWVERGWADPSLLDGYETEQAPVAIQGSGEMAEAARAVMDRRSDSTEAMAAGGWGDAFTRTLLGVSLDVDGSGDWSMVRSGSEPSPVRPGDRAPDLPLVTPSGPVHLHRLVRDEFVAMHFTDARRRPSIPASSPPGLRQVVVSRWDAPHDSGLRDRALFDPGNRVRSRFGLAEDTVVLVRPDGHVAAMLPWGPESGAAIESAYLDIVRGAAAVRSEAAR
ncbi:FAD-dependent monooxygenase [Aeromicrobium fastidiosum]|uniref:FAD-binding monooxygenase n=1 Tax=Aeromicrobium fastidiosum TaxID=52699 RepID=A0A641APY1_9ACTN|nr:FAD-dependent monooxygenase [Aeromicrobium fastidiosum]KAA1378152.1 FAD-binding monooxygenase [Aeromicrobium fastidiosum]MBP2389046.1 3-(3-hydroxy-phenyl)propionate hydroxylase [Aeromicrobium fastidiosum]